MSPATILPNPASTAILLGHDVGLSEPDHRLEDDADHRKGDSDQQRLAEKRCPTGEIDKWPGEQFVLVGDDIDVVLEADELEERIEALEEWAEEHAGLIIAQAKKIGDI